MGDTHFSGPVITGQDNGVPAQKTQGTLIAAQKVTVASNTSGGSSIVLPNCTITDIVLDVLVSASGNAQGMLVRVGTTADATRFANIKASATGRWPLGIAPNRAAASAAAMETVAGPQRLFVDVTAATSGGNVQNFSGLLTVYYLQR